MVSSASVFTCVASQLSILIFCKLSRKEVIVDNVNPAAADLQAVFDSHPFMHCQKGCNQHCISLQMECTSNYSLLESEAFE